MLSIKSTNFPLNWIHVRLYWPAQLATVLRYRKRNPLRSVYYYTKGNAQDAHGGYA